jgi:hypothetical protein
VKARLSFDEFARLADRVVDEIPPRLCRELNGGFVVLPEAKRDGELLILGEYVLDEWLGRRVVLYYGSFAELLGGSPVRVWARELRRTVRHELRHHLESLAGVDYLAREDQKLLARLEEQRGRPISRGRRGLVDPRRTRAG